MQTPAQVLGQFASELNYSAIPADVIERAKDCITDSVAAATFGARFPWSGMAIDYARRYGSGGECSIVGVAKERFHAPYAALSNGVLAHSFELDSVGGGHTGASILPTVLAACEEGRVDGKTAIAAFIAGCEISFRLADVASSAPEKLGFHGPGLMGVYGAAAAAGRVMGLNAEKLSNALGIAGSLSAGLLAFTKAKQGSMVKRLHLGRASESGIMAARLAESGYTGPESVLEGKFGFVDAYCRRRDDGDDAAALASELNTKWNTLRIGLKRYPCHVYSHTPVQALRELMDEHKFSGAEVVQITVEGSEKHKLLSHHNILEPIDIMQAQYSVPFCVALALFRDPEDPKSFDAAAVNDPVIRAVCRTVVYEVQPAIRQEVRASS